MLQVFRKIRPHSYWLMHLGKPLARITRKPRGQSSLRVFILQQFSDVIETRFLCISLLYLPLYQHHSKTVSFVDVEWLPLLPGPHAFTSREKKRAPNNQRLGLYFDGTSEDPISTPEPITVARNTPFIDWHRSGLNAHSIHCSQRC